MNLRRTLADHLARYPLMQVEDVYKLLHQAALGSEHAAPAEAAARKWLEDELESMGAGPAEPLLDPISPDGAVSRVHLRPCLQAGIAPEAVLSAFLRTSKEWRGSLEVLRSYGQKAVQLADAEKWALQSEKLGAFFATMEAQGFPAVHHSKLYAEAYRPAYRVIKTKLWRQYESFLLSP